jgi:hypothetical protein
MKKHSLYIILIIVLSCIQAFSQSNTFPSSGNAGVGTTSPSAKFHVYANASGAGTNHGIIENAHSSGRTQFMIASLLSGNYNYIRMMTHGSGFSSDHYLSDGTNDAGLALIAGQGTAMTKFSVGTTDGVPFSLITNNTERFYIKSTGEVGIGTTNPQAKLAVNGDIFSKKVKVTQSGWPDYVFAPAYRLRTLAEVELFIKQQHHLPDAPSAAAVEKDGLDLGDNQAMLLKKIEELTLYLIAQNKKLELLEKEVTQLKSRQ